MIIDMLINKIITCKKDVKHQKFRNHKKHIKK